MASPTPESLDAPIAAFLGHLRHERRLSPRTTDGYGRDLATTVAIQRRTLELAQESHRRWAAQSFA